MKTQTSTGIRLQRIYHAPSIEMIVLDNEISLILTSVGNAPPEGPDETNSHIAPDFFNKNTFYV